MGWVRSLGGMWVGRQVRVAGGELIVADVRRHHEPLHDHDVHRDKVVLDGWDALRPLWGAPVLLQEESCLSLEDGVFHVSLNPLHAFDALLTGEDLDRPAGAHGLAHVEGALLSSDEPVNDSVDHVRVVSGQVLRAILCMFSQSGAVVLCQVASHGLASVVDQLPKAVHLTDALLAGDAVVGGVGRGLTDRHGDGEADQQEGEHLDQVQATDEAGMMTVAL